MPKLEASAIERIIANTINETARGDPDDLAARIVAALTEAGFHIVSADGREDTALGPAQTQGSSTGAQTGIAGPLPAIPRRARPLSGTKQMHHQAVTSLI